jgi:hypothetical protein
MERGNPTHAAAGKDAASLHVILFLLCLCVSSAAVAAPLISVSYDVTGGSFNGPNSTGPITSGTVTFVPTTPISTPFFSAGQFDIKLSGPSGTFRMIGSKIAKLYALGSPNQIYVEPGGPALQQVSSGGFPVTNELKGLVFHLYGGFGLDTGRIRGYFKCCAPCPDCGIPFGHPFEFGNEVRTFVPEPSTGLLLGLGLSGLGVAGGARRAARKYENR